MATYKMRSSNVEDYRLIVCFDIEAENLQEAYACLREELVNPVLGLAWETSDEWYGPDGIQGDPRELQVAIIATLDQEEE